MQTMCQLKEALSLLREGQVIAYPTEAVYGLGCDPFNQQALSRLFELKGRPANKGVILLISDWSQLFPLILPIPDSMLVPVYDTWPGHVTWIFPRSEAVPAWLTGDQDTIAVRMSEHPIARALCAEGPIVSTSANLSGKPPARDVAELTQQFPTGIAAVVAGELGDASQPSQIYDVLSGRRLR